MPGAIRNTSTAARMIQLMSPVSMAASASAAETPGAAIATATDAAKKARIAPRTNFVCICKSIFSIRITYDTMIRQMSNDI
jgi:hypothetical protein